MNESTVLHYDKEAAVLCISFEFGEQATAAVELNDNILLRFNRAEKRVVGLTLNDYSALVQSTPFLKLSVYSPSFVEMVPHCGC